MTEHDRTWKKMKENERKKWKKMKDNERKWLKMEENERKWKKWRKMQENSVPFQNVQYSLGKKESRPGGANFFRMCIIT